MKLWIPWTLALIAMLFLGCPPAQDDDDAADDDADDDDTGDDDDSGDDDDDDDDDDTGDDDDDDTGDDDDDDTSSGTMTLSDDEFYEGDWPTISITVTDFEIDDQTSWCCYDDTAIAISQTANATATTIDVMLMIGLLAEGTQTIGLENDDGQVTATFDVLPFTIDDVSDGEPAGSGVAGGTTNYDALHFTGADAGQFVQFSATNHSFDPYLWITEGDGITFAAQNWYAPDNVMVDSSAIYLWDQSDAFARVCATDFANDPGQTFDLDIVLSEPAATAAEAEVESNDDPADPQELGMMSAGTVLTLTGEVDAVGHDANNYWNEDLDWFGFEVDTDTNLSVQLDWTDPADDYDMLIYDATTYTPDETNFDEVVGWLYAATLNHPERTSTVLRAGVPYVLFVAGWDGNPGTYEVTMAFSPEL